jgi:hypothetical protein
MFRSSQMSSANSINTFARREITGGNNVTGSALIQAPKPEEIARRSVMEMVSNTGEEEATTIRMPSYAQLLFSSTDRFNIQQTSLTPLSNNSNVAQTTIDLSTGSVTITVTTPGGVISGFATGQPVLVKSPTYPLSFQGIVTAWNNVTGALSINNFSLITGIFPATSAWTVYLNLQPQDAIDRRLQGNIVPFQPVNSPATILFTPPSSANSFTLQNAQYLLQGHFTRLAISQLQFQWCIPTIAENVNDQCTMIFFQASTNTVTTYTVTITPGFYTPELLAQEIENEFLAEGESELPAVLGFNVFIESGRFVFDLSGASAAAGDSFSFVFPDAGLARDNLFALTIGANYYCGVPTSFGTQLELSPPPMTYTRWIDICSSELTKYQRVKDSNTLNGGSTTNVIARVYVTVAGTSQSHTTSGSVQNGLPFTMCVDYNNPKWIKWNGADSLLNFDIKCLDEFGQLMYWAPNYATEFQFTLLASET